MIKGKPLSAAELKRLTSANAIPAPASTYHVEHIVVANNDTKIEPQLEAKEEEESAQLDGARELPQEVKHIESEYAGDLEDNSGPLKAEYEALAFVHPAMLVAFYNKDINTGLTTLYPWQVEISEELGSQKPTMMEPMKYCVCAANGSGKDAFVIAPFAVWFALCKVKSRTIITSSSGSQLTAQTETYIRSLCQMVNEYHGEEIFKIRQRYIRCQLSGSEIRLFATDEEGKAEGYHPIEANTEMAIIISEAKSVLPIIFKALRRCTGYNYWLEVSTPGPPSGDFYKHFCNWKWKKRITSYDCPRNLSDSEREYDKFDLGEQSAYYRSKHLAEFTSEEGECVIPIEVVNRCVDSGKAGKNKKGWQDWKDRVGIDLAAGGAENVVVITKGNWIRSKISFREKDTTITADRIDAYLTQQGIPKDSEDIYADDGGVGHAIIDMLIKKKWRIARQNNQSAASDKKRFSNKGAQNWYRAKRLIDENIWFFDPNANDIDWYTNETNGFYTQLSNRYYKQQETQGKIALESKGEAIANGRPSPDRADAFILSLTGLSVTDFFEDKKEDGGKLKPLKDRQGFKTNEEIEAWHEAEIYKQYDGGAMNGDGQGFTGKAHGSVSSILNRKKPIKSSSNWNN